MAMLSATAQYRGLVTAYRPKAGNSRAAGAEPAGQLGLLQEINQESVAIYLEFIFKHEPMRDGV